MLALSIVAGVAVVFPAFWCVALFLLSHIGGWRRLSQVYAAGKRPVSGHRHGHLFGRVGLVSYRGVLTVRVAEEGFFMEVMAIFRPGHPRLFIPWTAIRSRSPARFWLWPAERIEIGNPPAATVTLPDGVLPRGNELSGPPRHQ